MQLIRGQLCLTRRLSQSVITLGNFDGVHRGHQQLLDALHSQARNMQLPSVVITFEPQPQEFFHSQRQTPRLMRFREKWQIFKEQHIDYLVCLRFHLQLAQCSAEDFVQEILVKQLGVKVVIIGEDFHFGAKRQGDVKLLQQLGEKLNFRVIAIPAYMSEGHRISSTRIRHAIVEGKLKLAQILLGRPYFLCGKVVHGDGRGRQLGFPTANIHLTDKAVCVSGVYAVRVLGLDLQPLVAVASVGIRPMFSNRGVWLEVYILDFNRDIYNHFIKVEFLHKLRDEQRFANIAELIEQIDKDVQQTQIFFITSNREIDNDGAKKTT